VNCSIENRFDRAGAQAAREASVVHDPTVPT